MGLKNEVGTPRPWRYVPNRVYGSDIEVIEVIEVVEGRTQGLAVGKRLY